MMSPLRHIARQLLHHRSNCFRIPSCGSSWRQPLVQQARPEIFSTGFTRRRSSLSTASYMSVPLQFGVNRSSGGDASGVHERDTYTQIRTFASGSAGDKLNTAPSFWKRSKGVLTVTGVSTVAVGFAYTAYKTSLYVSGLSLSHGLTWGIWGGGVLSGFGFIAGFLFIRRFACVHPENLYKDVLKQIMADPHVTTHVGSRIKSGKFKAYAYTGGLVYKDASVRKSLTDILSLEPYGLQMVFQVTGDTSSAMVSARAQQSLYGSYSVTNLAVDVEDGNRLVLTGIALALTGIAVAVWSTWVPMVPYHCLQRPRDGAGECYCSTVVVH
eukprot:m.484230 g.484230  ORF g.484230 m.484230 type:complete len:326 (-) comp21731_c0_seq8:2765-3742(-)